MHQVRADRVPSLALQLLRIISNHYSPHSYRSTEWNAILSPGLRTRESSSAIDYEDTWFRKHLV